MNRLASPLGFEVEEMMRTPTGTRAALALKVDAPSGVSLALAVWGEPPFALPEGIERGAIPSQQSADSWANERSGGLIPTFPRIDPGIVLVRANLLVTRLSWLEPLRVIEASLPGHFAALTRHLFLDSRHGRLWIGRTRAAGLVVAVTPWAAPPASYEPGDPAEPSSVSVVSVLCASSVQQPDARLAAREVAGAVASGDPGLALRDVADELCAHLGGSVDVERTRGSDDSFEASLPAWRAEETTRRAGSANEVIVQTCVASFDQFGFEGAALTAAMARAMPQLQERRHLRVRFDRPFAVAAVAVGEGAWAGRILFDAFIDEGREPPDHR